MKIDAKVAAEAIFWFAEKLRELLLGKSIEKHELKYNKFNVGELYVFRYDAKHKHTLDYYDQFPIIIVLDITNTGFMGLNLHYLPPEMRMQFLGKLQPFISEEDGTKFKINYELLKTHNLKEYKACIKQYLFNHVRSKIDKISPNDWGKVVVLPSEKFVTHTLPGITKEQVWKDSLKIIQG